MKDETIKAILELLKTEDLYVVSFNYEENSNAWENPIISGRLIFNIEREIKFEREIK